MSSTCWPVFIPSLGRADKQRTLRQLGAGAPVTLVIYAGARTCRLSWIGFSCAALGALQGGLSPTYAAEGKLAATCAALLDTWGPEYLRPAPKKDGTPDVRFQWSKLRGRHELPSVDVR